VRNNLAPASRGDGAPGGGPPGDAAPGPDGHSADGRPGVRTADAGYGLTGMRERLRILDGTLEAGGRDGQWIVTARLPLPRPESMAS
jgi:hypothetical protein